MFNKRIEAKAHKVISDVDLNAALTMLSRTSERWYDGTPESVEKRLSLVVRTEQINEHLLRNASFRDDDIEFYATVKEALINTRNSLKDAILASEARDDIELPSFRVAALDMNPDIRTVDNF